jgi:hypothetical protein
VPVAQTQAQRLAATRRHGSTQKAQRLRTIALWRTTVSSSSMPFAGLPTYGCWPANGVRARRSCRPLGQQGDTGLPPISDEELERLKARMEEFVRKAAERLAKEAAAVRLRSAAATKHRRFSRKRASPLGCLRRLLGTTSERLDRRSAHARFRQRLRERRRRRPSRVLIVQSERGSTRLETLARRFGASVVGVSAEMPGSAAEAAVLARTARGARPA